MATYKDLNSFLKAIENDLENACFDIAETAREKLQSAIDDIELSRTWNSRSDRNESGAFKDPNMTISFIEKNGNNYDITAKNVAVGELYDRESFLTPIIESGEGYEFGTMGARPFLDDVQQEVNKEVINILDKHLK